MLYDTRAVLDLGDVTSSSAGNSDADNQIMIQYEVVLVAIGTFTVDSQLFASVGMEYDSGNYIWIASVSYNYKGTKVSR